MDDRFVYSFCSYYFITLWVPFLGYLPSYLLQKLFLGMYGEIIETDKQEKRECRFQEAEVDCLRSREAKSYSEKESSMFIALEPLFISFSSSFSWHPFAL